MKQLGKFLGWALLAVYFVLMFIWRWNHEAVRLYDAPPIPWPFK